MVCCDEHVMNQSSSSGEGFYSQGSLCGGHMTLSDLYAGYMWIHCYTDSESAEGRSHAIGCVHHSSE